MINVGGKNVNKQVSELKADVVQRAINVKAAPYNAKGDGVTDDTISIQAAIQAGITENAPVFIPTGRYKVTELFIDASIHLFGTGTHRSVLYYVGTNTCLNVGSNLPATPYAPIQQMYLHDFSVEADPILVQASRTSKSGIVITRTVHSIFERLSFSYFKEGAFKILGKADDPNQPGNSVYNNHYYDVAIDHSQYGFDIQGVISDSHFKNCELGFLDDYGFYFHTYNPGYNINIFCCTVVICKKCIYLTGVFIRNLSMQGCNFERFTENGVLINGDTTNKAIVGTIANNLFYTNNAGTEECIKLTFLDTYTIHSNVFFNSALKDINLDTTATTSLIYNNRAPVRSLITSISNTNTTFQYAFVSGQDLTEFQKGIASKLGDFVTEGGGKGLVAFSPDGTVEKRISVTNQGLLFMRNRDNTGVAITLGGVMNTTTRNTVNYMDAGSMVFDTTLNKPIWRNAANNGWVDATGTTV